MTNEEKAIDTLFYFKMHFAKSDVCREHFDMAIKALVQQPCEDCISREAVIQIIENKLNPCTDMFKCLEMSEIKEDVLKLPSVQPSVLDKIRAEIDQKQYNFMGDKDYDEGIRFGLMLAYQIIDKYKAESEDK